MIFALAVLIVAFAGGVMTAVAGMGVGSVLVPLLALRLDFKLAIAAAALPHLIATAVRAVRLRKKVDTAVFRYFGIVCVIASFAGAVAQPRVPTTIIVDVFAGLLVLAGLGGLTGLSEQARGGKKTALVGGSLSGFFGGIAGEQGGFRTIGLLAFNLEKAAFVATSTAIGVLIDVVRVPVYWIEQGGKIRPTLTLVAVACVGAVAGVFLGEKLFRHLPQQHFRRTISAIITVIGGLLFFHR